MRCSGLRARARASHCRDVRPNLFSFCRWRDDWKESILISILLIRRQPMTLLDGAYIATIIMGIAATLALVFAYFQTTAFQSQAKQLHRQQLEALARDHYQNLLHLCVQYPEYTISQLIEPALNIEKMKFDGDAKRFAQYEWVFVATSNALESIFNTVSAKHWQETIVSILKEHRTYLRSARYDEIIRETCTPSYQTFIDDRVLE